MTKKLAIHLNLPVQISEVMSYLRIQLSTTFADRKDVFRRGRYGSTTGGTLPLGLRDAVAQDRLKKGDLVLLAAVGAGYTTGGPPALGLLIPC